MAVERQTVWGKLIILDLFFGGIGAGIFPICFMLSVLGRMREIATIGALLGPTFVILGLNFLLLELGTPSKTYWVLSGLPTSWMSRGVLIQTLYIIFGLGYAIPAFWLSWWLESGFGLAAGAIALLLALVTAVYHGLLLSVARAIPLWSSSGLPSVFFFTSLCTGLGLMLLISLAYTGVYPATEVLRTFTILGVAGVVFIVSGLITTWSLLSLRQSATYTKSIKVLKVPVIAAIICLIIALILLGSGLRIGEVIHVVWISGASGLLLLAGGFIIRYSIIVAGCYYPLHLSVPQ